MEKEKKQEDPKKTPGSPEPTPPEIDKKVPNEIEFPPSEYPGNKVPPEEAPPRNPSGPIGRKT